MKYRLSGVVAIVICLVFLNSPIIKGDAIFPGETPVIATFSIVAFDPEVQEWGVAVQSKFLAVGGVVPFAEAGTGAVASQAWGNTQYGPEGLALLRMGVPVDQVVAILTGKDPQKEYRQLGVIDSQGHSAAWTGNKCNDWAGHLSGENRTVQGNILAGEDVIKSMAAGFDTATGTLAERLIAALKAGQAAGGDARGMQSAALLIVRAEGGYSGFDDKAVDLRVDDHVTPIAELERIYRLYKSTFELSSYMKSASYFKQNRQMETANACLNRALLLFNPETATPEMLNQIAWEMALQNVQLEKALGWVLKALEKEPESAHIWDTAAEIYWRLNRKKEALEAQTKAVSLISPDDPQATELKARLELYR